MNIRENASYRHESVQWHDVKFSSSESERLHRAHNHYTDAALETLTSLIPRTLINCPHHTVALKLKKNTVFCHCLRAWELSTTERTNVVTFVMFGKVGFDFGNQLSPLRFLVILPSHRSKILRQRFKVVHSCFSPQPSPSIALPVMAFG